MAGCADHSGKRMLTRSEMEVLPSTYIVYTADTQAKMRKDFEGIIKVAVDAGTPRIAPTTPEARPKDFEFEAILKLVAPGVVALISINVLYQGAMWSERLVQAGIIAALPEPDSMEASGRVAAVCRATVALGVL